MKLRALLLSLVWAIAGLPSYGYDSLIEAVQKGGVEDVKIFYDTSDVNQVTKEGTPLYIAIVLDKKEVADSLLAHGASLETRDGRGRTLLHWACGTRGNDKAVETLVGTYLVSTETVDDSGRTPLHVATKSGKLKSIRYLVEHNANLNALDGDERTPLDYARNPEIIQYLLSKGAKSNNSAYPSPQTGRPLAE